MADETIKTGRIKSLKATFGFISCDDGPDVFFHKSELKDGNPNLGTAVTFTTKPGAKGPTAVSIKVAAGGMRKTSEANMGKKNNRKKSKAGQDAAADAPAAEEVSATEETPESPASPAAPLDAADDGAAAAAAEAAAAAKAAEAAAAAKAAEEAAAAAKAAEAAAAAKAAQEAAAAKAAEETDLNRKASLAEAKMEPVYQFPTAAANSDRKVSVPEDNTDTGNDDDDQSLRETFDLFDKDKSGSIDVDEFRAVLRVMGQNSSEEEVAKMLASVDIDGNGEIDYGEFCQLLRSDTANEITRTGLKKYFNTFDQDLSGYITGSEMRHMMTGLGQDLHDEEIDELMNQYDADGSGQITIDEFEDLVVDLGFKLVDGKEEEEDIKIGVPEQPTVSDELIDLDQIDFKKLFAGVAVDGKLRVSDVEAAVETLKAKQSLTSLNPEENAALHWSPGREKLGLGEVIYKANHIAIIVSDVGRSAAFYSDILGLQQIRRPDFDRHGAWFTMGNLELHLIKGVPLVHSGEDLIVGHISIETHDIDRVPEILRRLDVPFRQNVSVPKGVQMKDSAGRTNDSNNSAAIVKQYFFRDPDGYYLEVCNCDVLTNYCLGKREELGGYDEGVKPLDSKDTVVCANIGLQLARSCRRRSEQVKRKISTCGRSLKGAPAADVARILGFSRAEVVDEGRLQHLISRSGVYGDVCQNETAEGLREILLLAGNQVAKAIQIIQFRAGGDQVFRPPAFFEQGEEKYMPKAFKVTNTAVGLAAEARFGVEGAM